MSEQNEKQSNLSKQIIGVLSLAAGIGFIVKSLLIGLGFIAICVAAGLVIKYFRKTK